MPHLISLKGVSVARALETREGEKEMFSPRVYIYICLPGKLWHDGKQQVVRQTAKPKAALVQGAAQLQGPPALVAGWARTGPTKVCQESQRQGSDDHRLTNPAQRNLLPKAKEKPRLWNLFLGCNAET